jgi:hypothetical protein
MPNNITYHGDDTYIFGIGDPAAIALGASLGLVPRQVTVKGEPEFVQEGKNSYGITAAVAVADPKRSCDIQGIVTDMEALEGTGGTFQLNGNTYIKTNFERTGVAGEYMQGTVSAQSWVLVS